MGIQSTFCGLAVNHTLIMKSLILIALSLGAAVVVNAQAPQSPPHPPPPPPPAHYPRPPVHGYRPSYGPSHGGGLGGLGGLLPFLLLGKDGGHGKDNLLPLLLLPLLLGKGKCGKPPGCVKPNTHNTLCGAGAGNTPCCVCSGGGLLGL